MLVLTRKAGEQIVIGDNIKITVVTVGPGRVKIGIEAPADVAVNRSEILEKKRADRATVAASVPAEPVGPPVPTDDTPERLVNRIVAKLPQDPVLVAVAACPADLVQTPAPVVNRANTRTPRLPRKSR
ncbi:MAG: carbon storage regulator [Fimbriiglobus sp.]